MPQQPNPARFVYFYLKPEVLNLGHEVWWTEVLNRGMKFDNEKFSIQPQYLSQYSIFEQETSQFWC